MVTSTSRLAYSDCFELMDKAIADQKGIKVKFARSEDAWHFRIRLHTARKIDRAENLITYPETDAMHGRSAYDQLTMRIRAVDTKIAEGPVWLRIERFDAMTYEVESLSEPETEPELFAQTAMLKVTAPEQPTAHETQPIRRLRRI